MTTITGTVSRVNDKGFYLTEEQKWFNISRFAPLVGPASAHVTPGKTYEFMLDKDGFVRSLGPSGQRPKSPNQAQSAPEPADEDRRASPEWERTVRIARQSSLKAAVSALTDNRGDEEEDETFTLRVLAVAETMTNWVLSPVDAQEDFS